MKYIRTKDNRIIELTEKGCIKENYGTIYAFLDKELSHHLQNGFAIVKQADTIEELCDCFSYGVETTKDISVARGWNINNRQIYGCILTDKGLIYIAKMNKEGKLELL